MLNIIKFKGCKRCGGDLFLERDSEGLYVSCLQCGAILVKSVKQEEPLPEPRRRKVLAHQITNS
jgi:predicted  nucleic acid-binding Zn-ribbon protein